MSEMSEWTPDERKTYLRAEKRCEALANEIEGLHFWIWRRELDQEPLDDGSYDDDDGPPPGWTARELN